MRTITFLISEHEGIDIGHITPWSTERKETSQPNNHRSSPLSSWPSARELHHLPACLVSHFKDENSDENVTSLPDVDWLLHQPSPLFHPQHLNTQLCTIDTSSVFIQRKQELRALPCSPEGVTLTPLQWWLKIFMVSTMFQYPIVYRMRSKEM